MQDIVKVEWPDGRTDAFRVDATVRGLFEEAGRPRPNAEKLREAFTMLDRKSADEARVNGIPVSSVVPNAHVRQAEWLRTNTDLIRAEADLRRRVERVLADPLNEGRSVADISKMLQEQASYSQSRAELTARDQTLKAYAQIQQARQTAAGITRYVWTTALDERVRPDHADLDGTVQAWDDPPVVDQRTGRRGHPGEDFQCRCTAVPVLEEDDDPSEPEPVAQQRELRERAVAEGRARALRQAPPREPRAAPPREPAMVPTQAELAAEQTRLAQERARREAEAAADRRIAEARARAAEVERRAAEALAAQERERAAELARLEAERARVEAERAARAAAADRDAAAQRARVVVQPTAQLKPPTLSNAVLDKELKAAYKYADGLKTAPPEAKAAVLRGTKRVQALDLHPELPRLQTLDIVDSAVLDNGVQANGVYNPDANILTISTNRTVADLAPHVKSLGAPDLWSMSVVEADVATAIANTTSHEYAHHLHLASKRAHPEALRQVDARIQRGYAEIVNDTPAGVNPNRAAAGRAPTQYARTNPEELWAESLTMYLYDPVWMAANKPEAFAFVQDVLRLLKS